MLSFTPPGHGGSSSCFLCVFSFAPFLPSPVITLRLSVCVPLGGKMTQKSFPLLLLLLLLPLSFCSFFTLLPAPLCGLNLFRASSSLSHPLTPCSSMPIEYHHPSCYPEPSPPRVTWGCNVCVHVGICESCVKKMKNAHIGEWETAIDNNAFPYFLSFHYTYLRFLAPATT